MVSKHSGDFAFIQHMIASLNKNGIMAVLVPNGDFLEKKQKVK